MNMSHIPSDPAVLTISGQEICEKELFLLCVLVTAGEDGLPHLSYVPVSVHRDWKFPLNVRRQILEGLAEKGLVRIQKEINWYGGNSYSVSEELYCPILKELVSGHEGWLDFFQDKLSVPKMNSYLVEAVQVMLGKREGFVDEWPYFDFMEQENYFIDTVLKHCLKDEAGKNLVHHLQPEVLVRLLHLLIVEAEESNCPDNLALVRDYLDLIPERESGRTVLQHHLCLSHFYAYGTLMPLESPQVKSSYSNYLDAAVALYEGRLDDSIASFRKALAVFKGKKAWKHIPYDTVSFLLYVIALGWRRAPEDIEALCTISKYFNDPQTQICLPVFALSLFLQSSSQPKNENLLRHCLKGDQSFLSCRRTVAGLILAFFKSEMTENEYAALRPGYALLQCELSACGIGEKGIWPYEPVLSRIKVYERWELELDDLIRIVSVEKGKAPSGNGARLVYLVGDSYYEYGLLEIREQNRLKNGNWGKGKKVSVSRYLSGEVAMDEIDRAVYDAWKESSASGRYDDDLPDIEMILPYLKGTDKVMADSRRGLQVLNVREEIPYLYTDRRDGKIVFGSNIPEACIELENMVLDTSSGDTLTYFRLTRKTMDMLTRLMALGSVPEAAEPMLERLFEGLKGQLEVHSEIAGATELEKVTGQTALCLRISPEGPLYRAVLHFCPLEGGSKSVFPGKGEARLFDSAGDRRVEVIRDLAGEKKNLRQLNSHLEEGLGVSGFSQSSSSGILLTMTELLELLEIRSDNPSLFAIEWPEGEPFRLKDADTTTWKAVANPVGGWFEIEGSIPLDEDHIVSMSQLLAMVRETEGRYIRLGDNDFMRLSDSLRSQLRRIDSLAQSHGNKVRINKLAYAVSADSIRGDMDIEEPEALAALRQRIRQSERKLVLIPDGLNANLRDYQEDGVRWMLRMTDWGAGVCLADDMGLGKTLQSIAVLLARKDCGAQMVVAPASVVGNWKREVNRFAPGLNVVMLNEISYAERSGAIDSLGKGELLVLTYGLLVTEADALCGRPWASVCLDEAHTIKNRDTKSSSAAMRLQSDCRIILTGTPIQNHLGELWNLMQFINPGLLGSYEHFSSHFIAPVTAGDQNVRSALKRLVSPFILRRTKQQVARELPDKEEIILPVTLSEEEMSVYEVLRREASAELESSSVVTVNALAMITKLREAACSASLVEKKLSLPSSKLSLMCDKLVQIVEQGNRVLVFSQFTSFLDMACREIKAAGIKDYFYLKGSTPVRERQRMVEAFQKGEKPVFLISLKAGGLGLNLTGANYVIHLDPWWNPAIEQQATDRAYRIGQAQKVTVYHLISEHTIEEKILRLHATKRSLADSLLEGSDLSGKLTAKELLEMLG